MEAPDRDVIYFGKTNFRNADRLFGIKRKDRRQHTYIIGKSGTGKSVLLHNMAVQDIKNGEGLCVVDPHGEFVEGILEKIPNERLGDVVYLNPADADFHIGFNILEIPDPRYKHLVASGLMGIFNKIWAGVWSARMEYILSNAILALLEMPGATLLGIPRILVDETYRKEVLDHVTDPVVKAFWITEFDKWGPQFRNEAIAPIQNKVGQFLSTPLIRNIVGQPKSTIDVFDIMNSRKIFLVNVSKGRIGEDNSKLLGAMIITKIQLAAMERVRIPEEDRADFYLYVDEFQNFATDSFADILSEARKYRLCLIMANQYIGQLVNQMNTRMRDAIFGNVGTMMLFRVGAKDAEFLEAEFTPEFGIQDMVNLPNYNIYLKLMVNGVSSRPFSAGTLPPFRITTSPVIREDVIAHSRSKYARPRSQVEEEINTGSGIMEKVENLKDDGKFQAICSSCNKTTLLPFEPQPGRPVYCKDCLTKIKAGTLRPVRVSPGYNPGTTSVAEKKDSLLSEFPLKIGGDRRSGPREDDSLREFLPTESHPPKERPHFENRGEVAHREPRDLPRENPIMGNQQFISREQNISREPYREPHREPQRETQRESHPQHLHSPREAHLSDLIPREDKPKQQNQHRTPIDIEGLRRAITESLSKASRQEDVPPPSPKAFSDDRGLDIPHEPNTKFEPYNSDRSVDDANGPSPDNFPKDF